ncbi:hypothetical protein [Picrophilus oshimae]|uniref:Uncharacterized protein n=1 Tax=Picrophilus torridus (strain ATCC 700027 / DSM 9790 / JCM 10055 / NBRC 100828 / KAW 2/3) TaxID=1122961 RepID=A0A8G2FWH4_PICTO|nr:hypothetical protein [Picrophilus oshimae]SMD30785.1 hypothetical protein SAMN02745355_0691 [Picrophilus oshimae DSM 9789]
MLDDIIISVFSAGLIVSIAPILYMAIKVKSIYTVKLLILIYMFFSLAFLSGIFSFVSSVSIDFIALFEALAFFLIYYNDMKSVFLSAFAFGVISDVFLVLSLYFVAYDLFIFYRKRKNRYSKGIFLSFLLFFLSILIMIINTVLLIKIIYGISAILLVLGVFTFSLPVYRVLKSDKNEEVSNTN